MPSGNSPCERGKRGIWCIVKSVLKKLCVRSIPTVAQDCLKVPSSELSICCPYSLANVCAANIKAMDALSQRKRDRGNNGHRYVKQADKIANKASSKVTAMLRLSQSYSTTLTPFQKATRPRISSACGFGSA